MPTVRIAFFLFTDSDWIWTERKKGASEIGLKRFEPGIDSRIDKNSYRFHFRLIDLSIQKKKIQSATPAREYAGYGAGGG